MAEPPAYVLAVGADAAPGFADAIGGDQADNQRFHGVSLPSEQMGYRYAEDVSDRQQFPVRDRPGLAFQL